MAAPTSTSADTPQLQPAPPAVGDPVADTSGSSRAPAAPAPVAAQPAAASLLSPADATRPGASGTATPIRAASPLEHQVAGHDGVMEDESGELVIKPALPREIAFYQVIAEAPSASPLAGLRPFLAEFLGTLSLSGIVNEAGQMEIVPGEGGKPGVVPDAPQSIVLENLAAPFTRPCVMDIKLGTVLHDDDAPPEKKARMEKKARESTIGQRGMRMTGCKTWHEPTGSWIETPRAFGYAMTPERLPEGMVRFFPLPSDTLYSLANGAGDALAAPAANAVAYTGHATPARLTHRVLTALDEQLAHLADVLGSLEIRAVGASLLVVYEGDPARLDAAFERWDAKRVSNMAKSLARRGVGVGEGDDEDEDEDEDESDSEYDSDEDSDDDDGVKADARRAARAPPLTVRLIDFAHTRLADGEGPDTGVLLGLETVRALVKGRMEEVAAWMAQEVAKAEGDAGAPEAPVTPQTEAVAA